MIGRVLQGAEVEHLMKILRQDHQDKTVRLAQLDHLQNGPIRHSFVALL